MLSKFKLGYDAVKATKNICCVKDEGAVDHSNQMDKEISLWMQEFQQSDKVK